MTEKSQPERMSTAERTELSKSVRARTRVRRNEIDAQKAVQLRRWKKRLAEVYGKYDNAWAPLTKEIDGKLNELDEQIAAICHARGIPEQFRPEAELRWYGRGENASKERRAELRREAQTTADAQAKEAKVELEEKVPLRHRGVDVTECKTKRRNEPMTENVQRCLDLYTQIENLICGHQRLQGTLNGAERRELVMIRDRVEEAAKLMRVSGAKIMTVPHRDIHVGEKVLRCFGLTVQIEDLMWELEVLETELTEDEREELVALLDRAAETKLNRAAQLQACLDAKLELSVNTHRRNDDHDQLLICLQTEASDS